MKTVIAMLLINSLSIVLAVGAIIMIWYEKDGWGWLLFACLLCAHTFDGKKKEEKNNKTENK